MNTEITNHDTLIQNKGAVDSYSEIANRLAKVVATLNDVIGKQRLVSSLEQYGGSVIEADSEIFDGIDGLKETLNSYKTAWEELKDKSLQDENNFLYNLESATKQKAKEISTSYQETWAQWLDLKRKEFFVPEIILQHQEYYGNAELTSNYATALTHFEHEVALFYFQTDQLSKINRLASQLIELNGQMNKEDLPEAVQKFLKSVNNYKFSRPTLDLLTEEVFIWLKKNDMLGQFMVTPNV